MPIYEYQCAVCGHALEAFQKISEQPLLICPKCDQPKLQKLISAAGFQLKGTGWYATDFKNKGKPETNKSADSAGDSGTQDKKDTKTDSGTQSSSSDTAAK
jgi:putative FmdB family regulatory protein